MANINVIPPDAEKLLFAADVVHFFLNDRYPNLLSEFSKTEIGEKVNYYREHVTQCFSENIKKMIAVIDETQSVLVRRDFLEIQSQGGINVASLREYNSLFKDCHFAKGFQARNFLMYCARIAVMACNFFSYGMKDALDICVDLITSVLNDETGLTWDSLEDAALKYANTKSDISGNVASFLFTREPTDLISSETEESSNSSTINSETDSVTEMQNMTSASSAESFSAAVTKLTVSNTEHPCKSGTASEYPQSNVLNPSEYSSTSSIPDLTLSDIEKSIRNAFLKVESASESSSSSSVNVSAGTSNYKSCLGKRPSPRKMLASTGFRVAPVDKETSETLEDDSETEIKKRKLSIPETMD